MNAERKKDEYSKSRSNQSSHDYEKLDDYLGRNGSGTSHSSPSSDGARPLSDSIRRVRQLEIDSHGYALVLPHEVDDTWEFDCLNQDRHHHANQDKYHHGNSGLTVKNVEEAWKHQLERGYAPLTLKNTPPPPIFSRTCSDKSVLAKSHPQATKPHPQDYEVPLHVKSGMPLPPPPSVSQRRISLTRQQALVREETDGTNNGGRSPSQLNSVEEEKLQYEDQRGFLDSGIDDSADDVIDKRGMRGRVMTAPAITFRPTKFN